MSPLATPPVRPLDHRREGWALLFPDPLEDFAQAELFACERARCALPAPGGTRGLLAGALHSSHAFPSTRPAPHQPHAGTVDEFGATTPPPPGTPAFPCLPFGGCAGGSAAAQERRRAYPYEDAESPVTASTSPCPMDTEQAPPLPACVAAELRRLGSCASSSMVPVPQPAALPPLPLLPVPTPPPSPAACDAVWAFPPSCALPSAASLPPLRLDPSAQGGAACQKTAAVATETAAVLAAVDALDSRSDVTAGPWTAESCAAAVAAVAAALAALPTAGGAAQAACAAGTPRLAPVDERLVALLDIDDGLDDTYRRTIAALTGLATDAVAALT